MELCYGHAFRGVLGWACLRIQCLQHARPGEEHVADLPEICATRNEECVVARHRCVYCGAGVCYECGGRGEPVSLLGDIRPRYRCSEHPCPCVVAGLRRGEEQEEAERVERETRDRLGPLGFPAAATGPFPTNNVHRAVRRVFLWPDPAKGKGKDVPP